MEIDCFTGGIFDTNCYFLLKEGILIDAPQEAAEWLASQGYRVRTLLITHCAPMLTEPNFFKRFGYNWEIEPVKADFLIEEGPGLDIEGRIFDVLHIPGHCDGSLCFYEKDEHRVFGGDVLFAGSIGRTDLPGGDHALLLRGIREKLWLLPDDTTVLSGHGPATTIGIEKKTNPFLR
jgi:glyoxylase-like metal-dependent hydrolase (beta-lactamase superfamily II)